MTGRWSVRRSNIVRGGYEMNPIEEEISSSLPIQIMTNQIAIIKGYCYKA